MIFKWSHGTEIDVVRYLYTAKIIAQGVYGNSIYYVLPELPKDPNLNNKCVIFPKLKTRMCTLDWELLKNWPYINNNYPDNLLCLNNIKNEINNFDKIDNDLINNIMNEWNEKLEAVEEVLGKTIIFDSNIIDIVEICLTKYGSPGTYNLLENESIVKLYIRIDSDISIIAELIIASLVLKTFLRQTKEAQKNYASSLDWIITESISDFLMQNTNLKYIFPKFVPTLISTTTNKTGIINDQSREYLSELGFSQSSSLSILNNEIFDISGHRLRGVTQQEFKVLKKLVESIGKLCTYDEIAETMWGTNYQDKFSLYAINKIVFQIRQKLRINNILSARIVTCRNSGYVLYC